MARKFMQVKRIVIPFLTLVILASQLAGCAALGSKDAMEESQRTPEIVIEYNQLDTSQQDMDGQQDLDASHVINVGEQIFTTDTDDDAQVGIVEDSTQAPELAELSEEALTTYFQKAYDMGVALEGDLETRIDTELSMLVDIVTQDNQGKLPEDYQAQYRAWRPVEEVQLFTDVEETVYATGTVNIRASYTAESDKLGSLSRGQSVTRTGTSIQGTEAEGWSRVQLSDGSTAYISNKYLSTTKPEVQKPQQNNQQQSKPSTSTGETSKPSSSTDNKQTETPSVEQQKPSSDKTAEEKIAEYLAKAQAACDARGDGSYAVINGDGIQIITPGGHMGSVELN